MRCPLSLYACLCALFLSLISCPAALRADVILRTTQDSLVSGNKMDGVSASATSLQLCNRGDTSSDLTYSRKVYLSFDRSAHPGTVHEAHLDMHLRDSSGASNPSKLWQFNIYGLVESQDTWADTSLTWNNAPGNDGSTGGGVALTSVFGQAPLASFTILGLGTSGQLISIDALSDSPLVNFINSDTDNHLSFIIVRYTTGGTGNTVTHSIASMEYVPANGQAGDWGATLTLMPEPSGLLMLALGAVGLMRRKKVSI